MAGDPPPKRAPRLPSDAELDLWRAAMKGATPLRGEEDAAPKERSRRLEQPIDRAPTSPPRPRANAAERPPAQRPTRTQIEDRMRALSRLETAMRARARGESADPSAPFTAPPPRDKRRARADARDGVDRNNWRRLTRGQHPIEARIDLHGLRQDEAKGRLFAFLANCQRTGVRTALVITGKGAGDRGALKTQTPRWLDSAAGRELAIAWAPAQPKDGGEGALYVRIKRLR